jgi:hypothetical protein
MLKKYQIGVKWSFQPTFNPASPKLKGFGYGGDEKELIAPTIE